MPAINDNTSPIIRKDSSHYKSSFSEKTGPSGKPVAKREFSKVLQKPKYKQDDADVSADDAVGAEDDEELAETDDVLTTKKNLSLFDLSSSNTNVRKTTLLPPAPFNSQLASKPTASSHEQGDVDSALEIGNSAKVKTDTVDATERGNAESPSDAYARLLNKKGNSREGFDPGSGSSFADTKESYTTRFATEQPDLSYVNPMSIAQQSRTENIAADKAVLPASNIQDLVNQLVEKAHQMQFDGKTETTLTLKQPPILAGTNLVLTGFDSARGEFNISFENLTQAAQNLLNMQANQDSLRNALQQKGYAVHIITTTTLNERLVINEPTPSDNQREGQREGREEGRQGRQGNRNG